LDGTAAPEAGKAARSGLERRPRKEDVRACYHYILGREPESEAVLDRHLATATTVGALRAKFLGSQEFRQSLMSRAVVEEVEPPRVETSATEEELDRLLAEQARVWTALGEDAPHWSVLAEERFRPEAIAANMAAFRSTGRAEAGALVAVLARQGLTPEDLPRMVEHGCGVGRVTIHLARHFPEISGVDVSASHLALARREASERGLLHLRWLRAKPGLPMPAQGYDLWYSRRVLQWNPPPLIRRTLELSFAGLAPGGLAVFQVPTWCAGYRFLTGEYLAGPARSAPELHLLPQVEVFDLASAAGLRVLEVRQDSHLPVPAPGPWQSQLFVMRKPS
jgi:SAM-dependent methyltransferase